MSHISTVALDFVSEPLLSLPALCCRSQPLQQSATRDGANFPRPSRRAERAHPHPIRHRGAGFGRRCVLSLTCQWCGSVFLFVCFVCFVCLVCLCLHVSSCFQDMGRTMTKTPKTVGMRSSILVFSCGGRPWHVLTEVTRRILPFCMAAATQGNFNPNYLDSHVGLWSQSASWIFWKALHPGDPNSQHECVMYEIGRLIGRYTPRRWLGMQTGLCSVPNPGGRLVIKGSLPGRSPYFNTSPNMFLHWTPPGTPHTGCVRRSKLWQRKDWPSATPGRVRLRKDMPCSSGFLPSINKWTSKSPETYTSGSNHPNIPYFFWHQFGRPGQHPNTSPDGPDG